MRRVLGWTAVVVLCCASEAMAQNAEMAPQLVEAQAAFDEATKLWDVGKYADAIPYGERALALREAVLGGTDPEVAHCLNLVGDLYRLRGNFARAEPLLQRGLSIREVAFGKNHPEIASSLHGLALLYMEQGLYGRAEPLFQRALTIREAALGERHPDVAQSLNYLAVLYKSQGLYGRAEPLFQRALAIDEAPLSKNYPGVSDPLSLLASLYSNQGMHGRAEPLHQRALAIREAALGKHHPELAEALNDLALLYADQGLYGRAEPLHLRALAILEAAHGKNPSEVAYPLHGKNHSEVAYTLHSLADIYMMQGRYGQAESRHQRALAIREAALGKAHSHVASSLRRLGGLYAAQGFYRRAEPLHQRALAIWEAAFGENHPLVASSLSHLAGLYMAQGFYRRAEPLHQRALAIREAVYDKSHPLVALSLRNLAHLHLVQHRPADALPMLGRAFTLSEERLRREALDFSGARLENSLRMFRSSEEYLYALVRAHPDDASVRHLALTAALLLKGRSAEETANTSRIIYRSLGAQDRHTFDRLRGLRTQLAKLSLDGPGSLTHADYQQRLKELADQGDSLEADLARRSAVLRALTALPPPADVVDRVAAALPQDGALVELIAYQDRPIVLRPRRPGSKIPSQLRYLALVLRPGARIRALDLGPAAPIDRAASRLRDALARHDAHYQGVAQALYRLAFEPLLPLLGDTRRIFLAPDGQLSLVPFAALHDGQRFLVDTLDFTYLTSGKDLLPRPDETSPARSLVVLADPDFGTPPAAETASPMGAPQLAERFYPVERFFSTLRADLAGQPWASLPGTRQEAEALQRLIPEAQVFLGPEATKERLLHLAKPGILHIATHGFFLGNPAAPAGARAVGSFGALGDTRLAQRAPDPMLRSGLVLAGARTSATKDDETARRRLDDALVTALELAGLDLWGTQLVVLSACDTGRGDVKLGQGVYGLRRALVVAGAETLVMSLWRVNDATTAELMEDYYRHLLAGKGRAVALRESMLALREKQPHPHFWAPFIVIGKDAPLRGLAPTPQHP
ncbi:CHAT domain-containing tetratricopeptide repeat protein [Hyalangium sp.]|uniref:CHAT domain-containing tetratricopeptide repeat protein n=1 Tax=Hyalangium sp. TaxID=2028555 RepID=UPI0039C8683F